MKTLTLLLLCFVFLGSVSCKKTYTIDPENMGNIYKAGYYSGISAAAKCVRGKTTYSWGYTIYSYEYADTLFIIDSLNYIKQILK